MKYSIDASQATGREIRCAVCRKPLPLPSSGQRSVICLYCNTEETLPVALGVLSDLSLRVDAPPVESEKLTRPLWETRNDGPVEPKDMPMEVDDDFEFKLEPEPNRPAANEASAVLKEASEDLRAASTIGLKISDDFTLGPVSSAPYVHQKNQADYDGFSDLDSRTDRARAAYNETSGLYPRERHYPTLESIRRLYYLFGYASVLIVFPYLAIRFIYLIATAEDRLLQDLADFSELAIPLMFGCVALTATLFGASEGIKLAIDIQDNTLRTANRSGRRKLE